MAKNTVYMWTKSRPHACTDPATPASGDPVRDGQTPGVALVNEDAAGLTTVAEDGQFLLSVKGVDGSGNSAVADGDIIYYVDADTPKLSKKTTGVRFGYARAAITSGSTATIAVEVGY
jgi:predicted RecA/RadA family phage recombinase